MTPTTLAEALTETLIVLGESNSAPLHSCYPGHHGPEYADEITAVLLALPSDQRAALAAELLDVELPEGMTPGEIHVYGGEGGIGITGWRSVGIPMGGTFTEHAFLWAIGRLLTAMKEKP